MRGSTDPAPMASVEITTLAPRHVLVRHPFFRQPQVTLEPGFGNGLQLAKQVKGDLAHDGIGAAAKWEPDSDNSAASRAVPASFLEFTPREQRKVELAWYGWRPGRQSVRRPERPEDQPRPAAE